MSQSKILIDHLKQALKTVGVNYADVAKHLQLSETSVKRMLASGNMSLQRLDAICELAGLDMSDLVRLMDESRNRISHLTPEQEQELVADTRLLLVAVCVNSRWRFKDIVKRYAISETECIHLLARLDRLKLIELLPGNRIKLLIDKDFHWLADGPIERFFRTHVQDEFLQSGFKGTNDARLFLNGSLSSTSIATLHRKLKTLASEFNELRNADAVLPLEQRKITGLVLATRHWELSVFAKLRREEEGKVAAPA